MKIRISLDLGEHDTHLFSVDTDAQKVAAMDWLTDYLDENCDGWSIGYHHGTSKEYLCFDEWTFQVGEADTHFAISIGNDEAYLGFYHKVATKALGDPRQWHPIVEHLPEMMSIDVGVMYL